MQGVTIAEKKVWVDQIPVPLLSGEVHYWRIDPGNWRIVLDRVKELGIQTVATYACWDFHEIAPGMFDFTGQTDPRRNLLGYLDLLTEMGFWVIFRPGPYIYSEWKNGGVPDAAVKYHRLDPAFQEMALPYMQAVTEAVRPYLATNGGRIILWQADNEIDPWPHLYTETLGLGGKPGIFHEFLRERYTDVTALNTAWRTSYDSFDQARAVSEMFLDEPPLMSRYNDFRSFLHWYVNRVAAWAVETFRRLGVNVPIVLNAYSGVATQLWADMEAIADLVGADIYPSQEYLHRPFEQRSMLEAGRYEHTFSRLPYIAEFEAGIWHDWLHDVGAFTPNHYRLICLTALQSGIAGWNWYMLVNRDNWYQSPINEWGRSRPELFNVFRQMTTLFDRLDPTTLEKITSTAVTFDPLQRGTQRPGQVLLQSFHDADLDYAFFDLNGHMTDKSIAFYAGGSWLSERGQQQLIDYVENGGHLVCIGAWPSLDEHLLPLNRLEIHTSAGIISGAPGNITLELFNQYTVESPWMVQYDDVPGTPITAVRLPHSVQPSEELVLQFSLQQGLRYIIGYEVQRGDGRITVIGLQPTPTLLRALHTYYGITVASRSTVAGVTSALFRRDGDYYLIITNNGTEPKSAMFELASPLDSGRWQMQNLINDEERLIDFDAGGQLAVALARKDGTVIRLTPQKKVQS